MRLLHLTRAAPTAEAGREGWLPPPGAPGAFLHACTASQLPGVLAGAGAAGATGAGEAPLRLVVLDVAVCEAAGAEVRWAAGDSVHGPFPHVHGAVPLAAVVAALELAPGPDGAPAAPDPALLVRLGVLAAPPGVGPSAP